MGDANNYDNVNLKIGRKTQNKKKIIKSFIQEKKKNKNKIEKMNGRYQKIKISLIENPNNGNLRSLFNPLILILIENRQI